MFFFRKRINKSDKGVFRESIVAQPNVLLSEKTRAPANSFSNAGTCYVFLLLSLPSEYCGSSSVILYQLALLSV